MQPGVSRHSTQPSKFNGKEEPDLVPVCPTLVLAANPLVHDLDQGREYHCHDVGDHSCLDIRE